MTHLWGLVLILLHYIMETLSMVLFINGPLEQDLVPLLPLLVCPHHANSSHDSFLKADSKTMQWPDTFAWAKSNLLFTSNRLQRYFVKTMDFNEVNFRFVKKPFVH
jgi:hypothetical protein